MKLETAGHITATVKSREQGTCTQARAQISFPVPGMVPPTVGRSSHLSKDQRDLTVMVILYPGESRASQLDNTNHHEH